MYVTNILYVHSFQYVVLLSLLSDCTFQLSITVTPTIVHSLTTNPLLLYFICQLIQCWRNLDQNNCTSKQQALQYLASNTPK